MPDAIVARVAHAVRDHRAGALALLVPRLLRGDSYLRSSGWLRSAIARRPIARDGSPLPWYTYGAIAFLEPRLSRRFRVFEYGCGGSTSWWAARVGDVQAVEHDPAWRARVASRLPGNALVRLEPLDERGGYVRAASEADGPFDIVVVDGRERAAAAEHACGALAPSGVILWDNSERERYAAGIAMLRGRGFRQLDFDGMGPIHADPWRTSVFYRDGNCLNI